MALLTDNLQTDLLIFSVTFLYGLYLYFTWSFNYWSKRNVPFKTPTPFVGNFWDVVKLKKQMGIYLSDMYHQFSGKYFGIWVFGTPHLIIRDPEIIKHILIKDFNAFADRTVASDEKADSLVANVLFVTKMPHWKAMRGKMSPIFTSGKIKSMLPLMNEAAEGLVKYLKNAMSSKDSLEAKEVCAKFSTEVITSCAFGLEAKCYENEEAPFRVLGRTMFEFNLQNAFRSISYFFAPALVSALKLKLFVPRVYDFCRDAFWQTINAREKSDVKRNDLIDMLIELRKVDDLDGYSFEGDRVLAQAVQFFAAGFETTSSTMGFLLYEMAMHQDMQQKLRSEIVQVLENYNGKVTYEAINEMPYLAQVIKETLRKYPILAFLDRRCMEDYKIPNDDLTIEKGTPVYIPVHGLHTDPKYFPDSEVFDPERFSAENINNIVPYSYLPFGQGPHNCIGERFAWVSIKQGIVHIFNNFFVECTEQTPSSIKFDPRGMVLQSDVALDLRFVPMSRKISRVG